MLLSVAAIFRQMMGHDLLRPDRDRHGALRMTEHARPILRGETTIELRRDTIQAAKGTGPKVRMLVSEEDAPLLSALKAKRRYLADQANAPAYIIFNDRSLIEMAERRPMTLDEMANIGGVGTKKLESYGRDFLEVIAGAVEDVHPMRRKLAGRNEGAVYDRLMEGVTNVKDLGSGVIGGVECDFLAFQAGEIDWQIWIAHGDRPYPCKYIVTSKDIAGGPQYSIQFNNWMTGSDAETGEFVFENATSATQIEAADLASKMSELPGHFKTGE